MTYTPRNNDNVLRDWLLTGILIVVMIQTALSAAWEIRYQKFTQRMGEAADRLIERLE